jgi:hypothetical protein
LGQVQQYPAYKSYALFYWGQIWFIRFRNKERKENFAKDAYLRKICRFFKQSPLPDERKKPETNILGIFPVTFQVPGKHCFLPKNPRDKENGQADTGTGC